MNSVVDHIETIVVCAREADNEEASKEEEQNEQDPYFELVDMNTIFNGEHPDISLD